MRERDRELRRRRKRRGERLRAANAAEVAKRKTARPDGSKRTGKGEEAAAAVEETAEKKPAKKSPARKAEGADGEKKPARKAPAKKKKDEGEAAAPEGEPSGS